MRYLAQFSEAPRTGVQSFWRDALATEEWLHNEGKRIGGRQLAIQSKSIRALKPWLSFQTQPLFLEAWLDAMEAGVTWSYLVRFLADLGPERVWIPLGDDEWIVWSRDSLVLRARRESWLWALIEDVWDPAGWSALATELEWWSEGRLQRAADVSWGVWEQRGWSTGWEEWVLSATRDTEPLLQLWQLLLERLGNRRFRVRWRDEHPRLDERLLGIPARYTRCELMVHDISVEIMAKSPEPLYVRSQIDWAIPQWSCDWSTVMTLRKVQRGTRLEATYSPRRDLTPSSWNTLRRERRQIPILQIRPLLWSSRQDDVWMNLCRESQSHHRRDRLSNYLAQYPWPLDSLSASARVRPPGAWRLERWASQSGLWVVHRPANDVQVHIEWPTHSHPGNIAIVVSGTAPIPMSEWIRASHFHRLSEDRRYWMQWIAQRLLPALEGFE